MATTPTPDGVLTVLNAANDSSTVVVSQNPPGGAVKRRGSSILDDSALGDEPQHVDMTFGKGLIPDEAKAEFRPGAMNAMDARRANTTTTTTTTTTNTSRNPIRCQLLSLSKYIEPH